MKKLIAAMMLVAGTAVGSGMIALPMLLAKLGIIPSIILMFIIWIVIYYTSLVSVELNLQAGQGLTLGSLGKKFSGKIAELIGTCSFKVLSYALLTAYLSGGTSILQRMLESNSSEIFNYNYILAMYGVVSSILVFLPTNILLYVNKVLFIGLFGTIGILLITIIPTVNWEALPLFSNDYSQISLWSAVIPVVFTSFGFQVIFHTLTDYCDKNQIMLKRVFYGGSLIPAFTYIIWTSCILTVVYQNDIVFYQQMVDGKVEIGDLIRKLSDISKWPLIQGVIWCLSSFAIITSVVGVGVGLRDSLAQLLPEKVKIEKKLLATLLTFIPAYLVAALVPNAFIKVLGFAGMILVFIAILLPVYLLYKAKINQYYYKELSSKWIIYLSTIAGLIIIICELNNIFSIQ